MSENDAEKSTCERLACHLQVRGKTVLEVGCGTGGLLKMIARDYHPERIVGVDPMLSDWWQTGESRGENWEVREGNAEALAFPDNSFDVVFSIATFEHIADVDKALSEIKRVLKPYGKFYTFFTPLWTSVIGHHFVAPDDSFWNAEHLLAIPPWGHLYLGEAEMREHLCRMNVDGSLIEQMLSFIYHSNLINRRSRSELAGSLFNCGMIMRYYKEYAAFNRLSAFPGQGGDSEMSPYILKRILDNRIYNRYDMGVCGIEACLEKYNATA